MAKFVHDCNNDGIIDCYDYFAVDLYGMDECHEPLPILWQNRLNECLDKF